MKKLLLLLIIPLLSFGQSKKELIQIVSEQEKLIENQTNKIEEKNQEIINITNLLEETKNNYNYKIDSLNYVLDSLKLGTCKSGDCQNGTGVFIKKAGLYTKYEGEFKNGKKHGYGVYMYYTGNLFGHADTTVTKNEETKSTFSFIESHGTFNKYFGEFKDGFKDGYGTNITSKNSKYTGYWKGGWMHGQGIKIYPSGAQYEGEWKYDEYHGYGVLTYADGGLYNGEFKNGKRNGQGTYYYPLENGTRQIGNSGTWKDDIFIKD